jgi:hypothetical protein
MIGTMFDGPVDWVTFTGPSGKVYQANVSFLLSNYNCIYGQGCHGLLNRYTDFSDVACCERGVTFIDDDDFNHVSQMVTELTEEDCDNIDHVRTKGWYISGKNGKPYKTRKMNDGCIFANRTGGSAGKPGCAFHHLAERTERHYADTKPYICWTVPLLFGNEIDLEEGGPEIIQISAFTSDSWGGDEDRDGKRGHMGFWCIDAPDAYGDSRAVYQSNGYELRKLMGNEDYDYMVELIRDRTPTPMPGAVRNDGRPLIPLLIEKAKADGLPERPA